MTACGWCRHEFRSKRWPAKYCGKKCRQAAYRARLGRKLRRSVGTIYFPESGAGGPIKIGWTSGVRIRLAQLQCGNPKRLRVLSSMPGTSREEAALQKRFAEHRIHLEWFRRCPALLAVVRSVQP